MDRFDVWVRPLGGAACRVRVIGMDNAQWLRGRLSETFRIDDGKAIYQEDRSDSCFFQVAFNAQLSLATFEEWLARIPEVTMMSQPA